MAEEKPVVIVDMDGTLADVKHRLHFIRGKGKPNWKKFFQEQRHDRPIKSILKTVCDLASENEIVIVTGRPEQYLHETEQWLRKYKVPYSRIFMRPVGDHRPDFLVKRDILQKKIGKKRVVMVFEDRPRVCEMYRQAGLKVIDVPSDQWTQELNEIYRKTS